MRDNKSHQGSVFTVLNTFTQFLIHDCVHFTFSFLLFVFFCNAKMTINARQSGWGCFFILHPPCAQLYKAALLGAELLLRQAHRNNRHETGKAVKIKPCKVVA